MTNVGITEERLRERIARLKPVSPINTQRTPEGEVVVAEPLPADNEIFINRTREQPPSVMVDPGKGPTSPQSVISESSGPNPFGPPMLPQVNLIVPPPPLPTGALFRQCTERLHAVLPGTIRLRDRWISNLSHAFEKQDLDLFVNSIRDLVYEAHYPTRPRSQSRGRPARPSLDVFIDYLQECAVGVTPIHDSWPDAIYRRLPDHTLNQLLKIPPKKEFLRLFRRTIPASAILPSVETYININSKARD
nr:MAG: hypothetical protein [Dicrocoelium Rhabdo-like virus 1]